MKNLHYVLLLSLGLVACGGSDTDAPATPPSPPAPAAAPTPPAPAAPPAAPLAANPGGEQDEVDEKLARAEEFLKKVEAGLKLAQALKTAVEDTIEERGSIPPTFADVRTRTVPPQSADVESIELQDSGSIVVEYAPEAEFPGGTIVLTPRLAAGEVTWECGGGSLPAEYRPGTCG
jgi:hypothetical protein